MQPALLKVRDLKKYFPIYEGFLRREVGLIKAVDGIDFSIEKGEIFGLVGESGSGKTTAARTVIRLVEPTEGTIEFEGQDFRALNPEALRKMRKEIQIVFQDPYASLNPRKTVFQTIAEAVRYHELIKDKKEIPDYVAQILSRVGLSFEFLSRYPHEISGGQQQRVCIGRAIALKPRLLVCDEAVSSLDVSVRAQILNLLLDLQEEMGLSILFISHDLNVVRMMAHRLGVMERGKIIEQGLSEQIFRDPQELYTKALLKAIPNVKKPLVH